MMGKNYFYCKSYQSFLMALSLLRNGKDVVIVTPTKDIIKTCSKLHLECISFQNHTIEDIITNRRKILNEIRGLISKTSPGTLHFSHTQFDVFCFLYVNEFVKNNDVVFYDFEVCYEEANTDWLSFQFNKLNTYKWLINILYRIDLIVKNITGIYLLGIGERFFLKNKIRIIENKNQYFDIVRNAIGAYQIKLEPIRNLFLEQNFFKYDIIERESLGRLYEFLKKQDIVVKLHPYSGNENFLAEKPTFDGYLPVEIILGNISNAIISIHSVALMYSVDFPIKAISLMKLLKFNDESYREKILTEVVEKGKNRVLLPETYEELEQYLK